MSGTSSHSEPREVDLDVARNLYDALMAARPYVAKAGDSLYFGENRLRRPQAREVLERADAALADAGELLAGVTS